MPHLLRSAQDTKQTQEMWTQVRDMKTRFTVMPLAFADCNSATIFFVVDVIVGCRFCELCLQRTPFASDGSTHCPMCRVPFHMKTDASHDSQLENEIAKTTIVCSGCNQQV